MRAPLVALALLLVSTTWAQDGPPLPPAESARRMTVPEGFKVSLFAGEPDVVQPIAMTFDDRGRLWVVECFSYPEREQDRDDRVVILEDNNHDGKFDQRTVFWTKGTNTTGIEYGFGGIWLTATPHLLFIPDADHDDRPDGEAQVVLDGWDTKARHNKVNGLAWGPDGWLYGMNGILSNSLIGPPGTPDDRRTAINCGVWRWHPTRKKFEVVATGTTNPWGLDFDQFGELFITNCVIHHLWHVTPGSHFQRMFGQDFNSHNYRLMESCADHIHWAGGPWQESRGNLPQHTDFGGGHAHVGCMIYQGDNWPERYRNQVFMGNLHGLRINQDLLTAHDSSYIAKHGPDFLTAADKWFRGISIKQGPDGGVYLSDWSDTGECHNYKEVDRSNGRIFKITYGDVEAMPEKFRDLAKLSDEELLRVQSLDNSWFGSHARRLLQERAAMGTLTAKTVAFLPNWGGGLLKLDEARSDEAWKADPDHATRLATLWTLYVTGELGPELLGGFVDHRSPHVRAWAVRLATDVQPTDRVLLTKIASLAKSDPSPVVRRNIASALRHMPLDDRWALAAGLISHAEDAGDTNLSLLEWYGIEPLVAADRVRAGTWVREAKIPLVREFIARRIAAQAVGDLTTEVIKPLVEIMATSQESALQLDVLRGMQDAFSGRRQVEMPKNWPAAYRRLSASEDAGVRERSTVLSLLFGDPQALVSLRATLADQKKPLAERETALAALLQKKDAELVPLLTQALGQTGLRGPAVRALAAYSDPATPGVVIERYQSLEEAERRDAIGTLASRPSYAVALLEAIESERIPRSDLTAFVARQLAGYHDGEIDARLARVWGEVRPTSQDKKKRIAEFKAQLNEKVLKKADLSQGRAVFAKTCASCHRLFDAGIKIGPDLTGSQRTNLDYVLENLLDPNAVIGRDYQMTNLQTVDGRVLNGIIREENDNAVTLQTPTDRVVVPKDEIENRVRSPLSMMPEELVTKLSRDELRNLIGYLQSPSQVALPEGASPAASGSSK